MMVCGQLVFMDIKSSETNMMFPSPVYSKNKKGKRKCCRCRNRITGFPFCFSEDIIDVFPFFSRRDLSRTCSWHRGVLCCRKDCRWPPFPFCHFTPLNIFHTLVDRHEVKPFETTAGDFETRIFFYAELSA